MASSLKRAERTYSSCDAATVKTTPLTSILEGITRDSVMRLLAESGIPVIEDRFTRDEIYIADEAFLTGTAAEVTPIRELDGRSIGPGKPGEITKLVQQTVFRDLARRRQAARGLADLSVRP